MHKLLKPVGRWPRRFTRPLSCSRSVLQKPRPSKWVQSATAELKADPSVLIKKDNSLVIKPVYTADDLDGLPGSFPLLLSLG